MDYVAADDFGHHGEIEITNFQITLGETMKHEACVKTGVNTCCSRDRRKRSTSWTTKRNPNRSPDKGTKMIHVTDIKAAS